MTGETILVVEDEGLIALHLMELLEKAGYKVSGLAATGEMVLQTLATSPPPDLILMDIGLAGPIDGIETARLIRNKFSIPLIFVTAYTSALTCERMKEVAPDGVIFKPFIDTDLLAAVAKALSRQAK